MFRSVCSLLSTTGRPALKQFNANNGPLTAQARTLFANSFGVPPIPIDDLAASGNQYSEQERHARCKLASLYRLVDARGWSMGIYNHITARLSSDSEEFLVNPFGLLYSEVTASNLIKVNLAGDILDQGTSAAGISLAGYTLHSAIHETRPDILCALHVHLPEAVAVATMQCGLLPITQEALVVHGYAGVSSHDYQGILINDCERKDIQESLGDKNKVLILKNHGVVCCGATVEEAYLLLDYFVLACRSQVAMMAAGEDNLVEVPSIAFENMLKMKAAATNIDTSQRGKPRQLGQQDFEACMRYLDRTGHRTGYPYQQPELKTSA